MKDKRSIEQCLEEGSQHNLTTDVGSSKPLIVRGVTSKSEVDHCTKNKRDFYYIDTGYFGNFPCSGNPGGKKLYHRIVKNENQHIDTRSMPSDRWEKLVSADARLQWQGWKNYNKKILLVMPNPKACRYYNIDYDTWVKETETVIKQHIDLPIEVRIKGSRSHRNNEYSIYDALDSGVYATVAMNSIAALESVLYGVPAFVTVPCAASPLSSNDLSQLKNPFRPDEKTIRNHCHYLAYGQFTLEEINSGYAWDILRKY